MSLEENCIVYCIRLQSKLNAIFTFAFKLYIFHRGFFFIQQNPPNRFGNLVKHEHQLWRKTNDQMEFPMSNDCGIAITDSQSEKIFVANSKSDETFDDKDKNQRTAYLKQLSHITVLSDSKENMILLLLSINSSSFRQRILHDALHHLHTRWFGFYNDHYRACQVILNYVT